MPPHSAGDRRFTYRRRVLFATPRPLTTRRLAVTSATAVVALALAGCAGDPAGTRTTAASPSPATSSASPTTASPSPTGTTDAASACVSSTLESLTPEQRLGQLLMVGFDTNASLGSLDDLVASSHVGNVIYLGGWDGADKVTRTSDHLQGLVSGKSTGDVGLLIAADQEGGEVHQLRGEGFTRPPSAKEQARMSSAALTKAATGWARELKAAGVNVNLAPVTDTVPADLGRANEPIGRWGRQYGSDPGDGRARVDGLPHGDARRRRRGHRQALPGARPDPQQHRLQQHRHHRRRHRRRRPVPPAVRRRA